MKKTYFFTIKIFTFLVVVLSAFTITAQKVSLENNWGVHGLTVLDEQSNKVKFTVSISDYIMLDTEVDNKLMKTISTKGILLQNSEGYPDVPGYSRYIAIPQGAKVNATVIRKQSKTVSNIEIAPAPRIPLDTEKGPLEYKKNKEVYSSNEFYPKNILQLSEPMKIRGLDVVIIGISPFQYNPVTKELIVNQDIEVEVTFEGGNGQFGEDRLRSRWWDPIIRDAVVNQASIPEKKAVAPTRSQTGCEYIIIIPDDPVFAQWADSIRIFRLKQGISTQVYTTTEIGGNTTTAIENFIDNAYNTWDIPPAACLLIGDY